jgi:hypothetical protein
MPLNLSSIPILDHHCHAFLRRETPYTAAEFLGFFSEGGDAGIVAQHTANSIFVRWATKELARFFGCEPTLDAVLNARAQLSLQTLAEHMLREANIPTLLIDYGFAGDERLSVAGMRELLPQHRFEPILRLETMAQDLIVQHETYDQFIDVYAATVEDARAIGHVGLKSIIAYRTGLAIRHWDKSDVVQTWSLVKERARRAGRVRLADKPLNDQLVLLALDVAARQELPIQFHTGLGDNDLDMLYANPLHMRPLFEDSRYQRVPFVLLHASYPYVRELGYLASLYSNVWLDLGLAIPYATIDIPAVWRQALSLTPFSKILFSTDAYSVPEIFWLAARWGRWGLSTVLDESIALGALSHAEASEAAEYILYRNASRLYQVTM